MNPHASPWNRPQSQRIQDQRLSWKWAAVKRHLSAPVAVSEYSGTLTVQSPGQQRIYLAKNSSKFRLRSHLDWAYYTPKTLAQAIDTNTVDQYYEVMLNDVRSDPNVWNDQDFEMQLKSFYAARAGRCDLV